MKIFSLDIFGITFAPTWYGLMYALGFLFWYLIIKRRKIFTEKELDSLLLFMFIAVVGGWRLGYVLFYNLSYFVDHPLDALKIWEWGMSFHGATIAVILALILWSYMYKKSLLQVSDEVIAIIPIGLMLGRIGNYINSELYGYANYTGPFAMMHDGIPHFPSPLLEALLEWVFLLIFLQYLQKKNPTYGTLSAVFLIGYGIIRFCIEFFRLPDTQIGYLFGSSWFTMGQLLSLPMIALGIILLIMIWKKAGKS